MTPTPAASAPTSSWRRPTSCGHPEDAWTGAHLRVGEALFRVVVPTPRCVVPTLRHDELPPEPALMRAVARDHRIPLFDPGRLSYLGVYPDVLEPGTVRVGDPVVPVARDS
ncbi:hypothetical protein ABZ934_23015 [Streptomyces sp. NPDC046557]|uniref:MOSC domain-containing protein n=1 Tax=Streptomyces sp. NPDC046557 TaxID=3155372 RepID=UPI0033F76CB3